MLDLFMVEPVRYEKKDGKWYTHDGTDIKDTQKRKGECSLEIIENILFLSNNISHERGHFIVIMALYVN